MYINFKKVEKDTEYLADQTLRASKTRYSPNLFQFKCHEREGVTEMGKNHRPRIPKIFLPLTGSPTIKFLQNESQRIELSSDWQLWFLKQCSVFTRLKS